MKDLWKPTVMLTAVSFLAVLVGFISQLVTAALFGAGADLDAFLIAGTLPAVVTATLLGSLNLIFIPIIIEHRAKDQMEGAWRIASVLLNLITLVLGLIAIAGMIFAPQLIAVTAPGLPPSTSGLAASLARWMWPTIVATGVSSLLAGIYQAQQRFMWPAVVPVISSLVGLAVTVVLAPSHGVLALTVSTLVSGILGVALMLRIVFSSHRYHFILYGECASVATVMRLMLPLTIGRLFTRSIDVVDRYVASGLADGSISYLNYSKTITGVAGIFLTHGVSTTIFPLMSERAAARDISELRRMMSLSMRLIATAVFPAVAIGAGLSHPLITTLLERGRFDSQATMRIAAVLPWYFLTLVGSGLGVIVGKGFYVLQDTKTVAIAGVADVIAYMIYMPLLASRWGYIGVAASTALYVNVSIVTTGTIMWYKLGAHGGMAFVRSLGKTLIAAFVAGLAARSSAQLITSPASLCLVVGGTIGALVYAVGLQILRSAEWGMMVEILKMFALKASKVTAL